MSRLALFLSLAVLSTLSCGVIAEDLSCPAEPPAPQVSFFNEIAPVSCVAPREKSDPEKHAAWIAELNSDDSEVRAAAFDALSEAGEAAIPAVKEAFLKPVSLEQTQRLSTLLIHGEGFGPEAGGVALRVAGTRKHLRAGDALELTVTIANRGKTSRNLNIVLKTTDGQTLNQVNYIPVNAFDLLQNDTNDVQQQQGMLQSNTWNRASSPAGYYVDTKSSLVQTIQLQLTEDVLNALKSTCSKSGEYSLLTQAIPLSHYYYESREQMEADKVQIKSMPIQFQIE